MAGIVDFSAHGVLSTATSKDELTENDWTAASLAAINLIGSATLITSAGTGPKDRAWVANPEWRKWAELLQRSSNEAGLAIQRKDRPALLDASYRLATSCQSCHAAFRIEPPSLNKEFAAALTAVDHKMR